MLGLVPTSALSSDAGVAGLPAKSLKINERFNAGVAGSALQNRGLQVRFLPGLLGPRRKASRPFARPAVDSSLANCTRPGVGVR